MDQDPTRIQVNAPSSSEETQLPFEISGFKHGKESSEKFVIARTVASVMTQLDRYLAGEIDLRGLASRSTQATSTPPGLCGTPRRVWWNSVKLPTAVCKRPGRSWQPDFLSSPH